MNTLLLYVLLTIANVIIQTIKSLATIKCGKSVAAIVNALAYGLYVFVIFYTMADFPLWQKALITAVCNLIGVYIVKWIEEKSRKDKLWRIDCSVPSAHTDTIGTLLEKANLHYSFIETSGDYDIFQIYAPTQKESIAIKDILAKFSVKYFVSETKEL